ncbi:MAG: histidine-type phosphatase [Acidiphilium sp.]|nr:histidine-type phosphatase [Acidiphilium sp.]MDD4936389.1 histidine-type phosphatase [Acidiphilium sp.]
MKLILTLILAAAVVVPACADASGLIVDRVVVLMRHGVRSPTHEPPVSKLFAPDPWPKWPGKPGDLTAHGAAALRLLGAYERGLLGREGVLGTSGCPLLGAVSIHADVDERTVASGQAFADGFAPGCNLMIDHRAHGHDPLFSGLGDGKMPLNAAKARAAILVAAGGTLADAVKAHITLFQGLQAVLDPDGHAILDQKSRIVPKRGVPEATGPLKIGKTASETLLLEYEQGLKRNQVGWGRVDQAGVARLLALHPLAGAILHRPLYIASLTAGMLAQHMLKLLSETGPLRYALLVGHDTTIDELGGLLDLHWHPRGFPADDPPPDAMLGFMRLTDPTTDKHYVEAFFQVQGMNQVRDLTRLNESHKPRFLVLPIPGCPAKPGWPGLCTLAAFRQHVDERIVVH